MPISCLAAILIFYAILLSLDTRIIKITNNTKLCNEINSKHTRARNGKLNSTKVIIITAAGVFHFRLDDFFFEFYSVYFKIY
jgi:hypothetical protein